MPYFLVERKYKYCHEVHIMGMPLTFFVSYSFLQPVFGRRWTRCWHPVASAAARMLLASLLTPWMDVLLLLLLTLAAGQPACCIVAFGRRWTQCWHPAARTATAGLAASTLLLALAVGQPACCIVVFVRFWTRCWHPAPRALLMMPAIRGPCVLKAAPLFW